MKKMQDEIGLRLRALVTAACDRLAGIAADQAASSLGFRIRLFPGG